jgi:hypothetical protein
VVKPRLLLEDAKVENCLTGFGSPHFSQCKCSFPSPIRCNTENRCSQTEHLYSYIGILDPPHSNLDVSGICNKPPGRHQAVETSRYSSLYNTPGSTLFESSRSPVHA